MEATGDGALYAVETVRDDGPIHDPDPDRFRVVELDPRTGELRRRSALVDGVAQGGVYDDLGFHVAVRRMADGEPPDTTTVTTLDDDLEVVAEQ